jgi:hypothetical protein
MLVGSSECLQTDHSLQKNRQSRVVKYYGLVTMNFSNFLTICYNMLFSPFSRRHRSHGMLANSLRAIERKLENMLDSFSRTTKCKHRLCNHRYNCLIYPILVGFTQCLPITCLYNQKT